MNHVTYTRTRSINRSYFVQYCNPLLTWAYVAKWNLLQSNKLSFEIYFQYLEQQCDLYEKGEIVALFCKDLLTNTKPTFRLFYSVVVCVVFIDKLGNPVDFA